MLRVLILLGSSRSYCSRGDTGGEVTNHPVDFKIGVGLVGHGWEVSALRSRECNSRCQVGF